MVWVKSLVFTWFLLKKPIWLFIKVVALTEFCGVHCGICIGSEADSEEDDERENFIVDDEDDNTDSDMP